MEVIKLKVPRECFPRLSFAYRNISGIQTRFNRIQKQAGWSGSPIYQERTFESIIIHVHRQLNDKDIFTNDDIVKRYSNKIIKMNNDTSKSINECLEIVIISSSLQKEDVIKLDLQDYFAIYVARSTMNAHEVRGELKYMVSLISTKESLARDIDDYLESEAYKPLRSYYKNLLQLLPYQHDDTTKDNNMIINFETPRTTEEETIEQLLEEIMALYNISNIPIDNRPEHVALSEPISNGERISLFKMCPTIKAIGHRFGKVHIYLEELKNLEEMKEREQSIAKFMDDHNIKTYSTSIVFSELDALMTAGSEIVARDERSTIKKSGSLGCFAEREAGNSKNVFLVDNEDEKNIGKVLQSTTKHEDGSLDISAAEIIHSEELDPCAKKLKDSNGTLRGGNLEDNMGDTNTLITGKKVHIWGSKSKPGKGVITDANYFLRGMNASLVEIKNEECYADAEVKPFAEPGDSGAIVCSDDPDDEHVNAHAMLMGSNTNTTYLALPLKEGIKQLDKMTGSKFTLFEG